MEYIKASSLTHRFDYTVFENIDFTLCKNETVAIVGVSGSGKSTFLNVLSSLLEPSSGTVELFDKNIYTVKEKELIELRKHDLGIVFQSHYLLKGLSAFENLEVASILSQNSVEEALLEKLNIGHVIHQKITELSGGQQQRVSIARVLTKKPRIIFADEPTGNLDHATAHEVIELFLEYVKEYEASMVLVTHDESLAYKCQKVYRLHDKVLECVKG